MDADKHPEIDVTDDQFNEIYPIGEVVWPMIRDSPAMRAKFRFQSEGAIAAGATRVFLVVFVLLTNIDACHNHAFF